MNDQARRGIAVNQVGYPVQAEKKAVITSPASAFQVVEEQTGKVVFEGTTGPGREDEASGATVHTGDFSAVTTPGNYRIVQEDGKSAVFAIAEKPYHELQQGLLKAFYYFRCGVELTEEFAGAWNHRPCHMAHGKVWGQPELQLDGCGGWHDAGDYGKYSGPGAKAVADLLLAYECYPSAFESAIPIPESNGLTPDILLECQVELNWLFKMQNPDTGGVFHKLTTLNFPDLDVMPEDDTADLYFSPVSATATGDFAAVMAMAARIYHPFDKQYAQQCLDAAILAWKWLEGHPDEPGFTNPPDITTGQYDDEMDTDERYWAAAELYRTTRDPQYHEAFQRLVQLPFPKYSLGWADMGGYGTFAYLFGGQEYAEAAVFKLLSEGLLAEAERLLQQSSQDGYGISLRTEDYIWGSNMLVMNNAMLLLAAERVSGDSRYADCALNHLHYLMGCNSMDISYVTGFGDRSVRHPHHRPSVGDGVAEPVPGLVSGGPDRGLHDEYVVEHLQGRPAAQCFADHELSYSTNEVTIYWNSPAVFVTARFNSKK